MRIIRIIVGSLKTNCYLLVSGKELTIIDPGDEIKKILTRLKKEQVKIKYIIITHYHFDHTFYSQEIKKIGGGIILFHQQEQKFMAFKADKLLKNGDEIKIGNIVLQVIHTPGHTAGSICLLGEDVIFTGDTIFKTGYGRTDLPGGSDKNMHKSLERLQTIIKPGMTVYPGHGEIFKA